MSILLLITVLTSRPIASEILYESKIPRQENDTLVVRRKRQVFDASCKGVYDRRLWAKLNKVCLDCQNIYRGDSTIEEKCR